MDSNSIKNLIPEEELSPIKKKEEYLNKNFSNHIFSGPIKKKSFGEKRNKYTKISEKKRKILLDKVFYQSKNIKLAAEELKINYSSAKTILYLYRKQIKKMAKVENSNNRCSFRVHLSTDKGINVSISHGGKNIKNYFSIQNSDYVTTNFFKESTCEILSESSLDVVPKIKN